MTNFLKNEVSMNKESTERTLSFEFYKKRDITLLGLGDELEIRPFVGKSQKITLNRTQINIVSFDGLAVKKVDNQIYVPSLIGHSWSLTLRLCRTQKGEHDHENSVFLLKADSLEPFNLNGSPVYESLISQNDQVRIGPTTFIFKAAKKNNFCEMDKKIQQILENKKIINSDKNILIEGETGTGKTFLAKKIYEESDFSGEFIHLNINSYSPGLIESELFGHIKGAFTGAINEKRGALSAADNGILFLDEIDSLSLEMQTKLLIFLDTKEYRPVGSEIVKKSKAKIIFASGRPLKELMESEKIRKDFYFRLNSGFKLFLPSLRSNKDLIKSYIEKYCTEACIGITHEAMSFYQDQNWPGNIRQLLAHIEKKKMMMNGPRIMLDETDSELLYENNIININIDNEVIKSLQEIKEKYAFDIYLKLNRQIYETSKALDISPNTLKKLISTKAMP